MSNTRVYYLARWREKGKEWQTYTMAKHPTLEQATKQFHEDHAYFYSDIEIEIVKVEETVTVVQSGKGSNERMKRNV